MARARSSWRRTTVRLDAACGATSAARAFPSPRRSLPNRFTALRTRRLDATPAGVRTRFGVHTTSRRRSLTSKRRRIERHDAESSATRARRTLPRRTRSLPNRFTAPHREPRARRLNATRNGVRRRFEVHAIARRHSPVPKRRRIQGLEAASGGTCSTRTSTRPTRSLPNQFTAPRCASASVQRSDGRRDGGSSSSAGSHRASRSRGNADGPSDTRPRRVRST